MVTTLIAYATGTSEMLDVCLSALERHEAGAANIIKVITDKKGYEESASISEKHNIAEVFEYEVSEAKNGSMMHGLLLDAAVKEINTDYILTLDSDCFPVASGWLRALLDLAESSVISGILWPWIPPPSDLDKKTIEYRIRMGHSWNDTAVICQLVRRSFILDNKLRYVDGDDTGFALTKKAHEVGMPVRGLMPTRCALPSGELNPEMNRFVCMVYGDMIYHQGGSTRKTQGASIDPSGFYDKARERVFEEKGAEWILQEGNNHKYRFDNEEEVAQFKMRTMFDEMKRYLLTHGNLFESAQ